MSVPPRGWLRDLWSSQGFLDGVQGVPAPSGGGGWPANISFAQVLDEFVPPALLDRFVVNLGANDGSRHDPAFPLLVERGYGGVFCEGASEFKARLYANLEPFNASGNVRVAWGFASAATVAATLQRHGSPREPDALKIDTDGIDAALLEGVLAAGLRPKAVVVEVNPDIPPPIQLVQLDHRDFTFDFKTKHMRGWLGASADGLFKLMHRHDYSLVALELGTREHLVCVGKGGARRICRKAHTCTHCENNMWFVRSDLLRASGTEPPTWSQFVNAFWRQLFAFNTYRENSLVFPQQSVRHSGHFTEADELRPYHPACYSLSDHQFTPHRRGEPQFVKPACPLQTMRSHIREHASEVGGWRDWARLSVALAQPKSRKVSEAWALAIAESIRATACREHEACPFNATSHVFAPRRGSHQVLQSHEDLEPAGGYAAWVNPPSAVAATNHQFVMNSPWETPDSTTLGSTKINAKIALGSVWAHILGFRAVRFNLSSVHALVDEGKPVHYLTLLNDHQEGTQSQHDEALAWDRSHSLSSNSANVRFIGQPGQYIFDSARKTQFCRQSEALFRRTGDPSSRFAQPCASPDDPQADYAALVAEQRAAPRPEPIWLSRPVAISLRRKPHGMTQHDVLAMGNGLRVDRDRDLVGDKDPGHLKRQSRLLMRYLDPPLLNRNTHLGKPVEVRVELRVFGMVQFDPLRVWVSRHGFTRCGTPALNYSTAVSLDNSNLQMWNINSGVDGVCSAAVRRLRRHSKHLSSKPCDCVMMGDTLDTAHGEAGFSTTGTFATIDHIARRARIAPSTIWKNVDDTLVRSFMADQENFLTGAGGASLSRWNTPFVADVGLGASGTAHLYEVDLRGPAWKSAGHYPHAHVDRSNALGIYGSLALSMGEVLMKASIDEHHRTIIRRSLGRLTSLGKKLDVRLVSLMAKPAASGGAKDAAGTTLLLDFLRDQGLAAALGFRRAWPSMRQSAFEKIAAGNDLKFARALQDLDVLLPSLDAESPQKPPSQAWGIWENSMQQGGQPLPFVGQLDFLFSNETRAVCLQQPEMLKSYEDGARLEA